jgi:glycosyltransferase involved in cell wall biosynthesis
MRTYQFLPWFKSNGIDYAVSPLFTDSMLREKYRRCDYSLMSILRAYWRRILQLIERSRFDLIWIEKEALPWWPVWLEGLFLRGTPYVLDFDDAIFHKYDQHRFKWVRRIYGHRIDRLMAGACLVVAGNHYLANRATAAGARHVEVIPTVVDLVRYGKKLSLVITQPRIVWIGSPSTVQYLLELAEPLRALAERQPFTLRVVGGGAVTIPGVNIESLSWSADKEAKLIAECDVGIMPLRDTSWERGKCAYKLIQYMACGLPTVASPIGANRDVVVEGETGLFANTPSAWVEKLESLLTDAQLRQRLGQAGRERVEAEYSLQQVAPRLTALLNKSSC